MNNKRTFFISLVFLTSILACAIPIPGQQAAPLPQPTVDTGILSTMVAETVAAAVALTEQAVPTATIVPTETIAPTITIAPTAEIVPSGSTLTIQEDGTTTFVDERAGFEVTLPADWLAVRIDQQEYRDALTVSPDIQKALATIQNNDPNTFRLYVLDTQEGHLQEEFFTNISFIWDEGGAVLLKDEEALKARAIQLAGTTPGYEILSTKFSNTSNGVLVGLIESKFTAKNSSDEDITIFQKQVFFNSKIGLININLSTIEAVTELVFPAFDTMLDTIKISSE